MSELNSILLEGRLTNNPIIDRGDCTFTVQNVRTHKIGEEWVKDFYDFDVRVSGKLAEVCSSILKADRGVRVVGRVACRHNGHVYIVGEHVDFKPIQK